jgi:hypothetical protein
MNEEQLKPRLTKEFLETLVLAARVHGWTGDHTETQSFVRACHYMADVPAPEYSDLEPFDDDEDA